MCALTIFQIAAVCLLSAIEQNKAYLNAKLYYHCHNLTDS